MTDEDPVQRQVEAYNAHDASAFAKCYADDAVLQLVDGSPVMTGRAEIEERYSDLFTQVPDLHVEIPQRLRSGDWVVDQEVVTVGGQKRMVAVAYHLRDVSSTASCCSTITEREPAPLRS